MFDIILITLFVFLFSFLHSYYNKRNKFDKYYVFILTEFVLVISYLSII